MIRGCLKSCAVLTLVYWGTLSCASLQIEVATEPSEAEVLVYESDTKRFVSMGQSPLTVDRSLLREHGVSNSGPLTLALRKPGYAGETMTFDVRSRPKVELDISLQPVEQIAIDGQTVIDTFAQALLDVQESAVQGDIESALSGLQDLLERYPGVATLWDISGGLHVLKGDTASAIASYERALELQPGSQRLRTTLNYLKQRGDE